MKLFVLLACQVALTIAQYGKGKPSILPFPMPKKPAPGKKGRGLNILSDDASISFGVNKDVKLARVGKSRLKLTASLATFSGDVTVNGFLLSGTTNALTKRVEKLENAVKKLSSCCSGGGGGKTTKPGPGTGVLPGTKLKCGALAGPICMGYNIKCWKTSLANCKATCAKTAGCKIAEYSTGGTCCTSKVATKKECKGSFTTSSAWKGYVVCRTLKGTKLKCGGLAGPICMGYNIKCWGTSLANCKATCKKTAGCKIAEYAAASKTCCTSKVATKKECKGSFMSSSAWKGYVVCDAKAGPKTTKKPATGGGGFLPGTKLKCGKTVGPICMGYNIKCWKTTLANCKSTCAKTKGCKIAEWAPGSKTCCTSKYATKKACPGSFTSSRAWVGYAICPTLPGTSLVCGSDVGPICMGYNIKCWKTTLANCKSTCAKTAGCKIAEYAASSKTCCTSKVATKKECKGSFVKSSVWKGYAVCKGSGGGGGGATLPGTSLKCGGLAGPICMGYNIKCFRSTLAGCKDACKKAKGCKIAEFSTGGTCCTSKYATKAECPGSFTTSKVWKGYVVCGAPGVVKPTKPKGPFLPGTKLVCGKDVGPICMGYNIKCWRTSLANCKSTCAKTAGCKIAEYSTSGTCCTSKVATKKECKGSFVKSSSWKGYAVCGSSGGSGGGATLPGTSLKCGGLAGPICMGYNIKCWKTSLANCKATCKKTAGCTIAEYSTGGTCCTSKYATKAGCPGSFTTSSSWKGYVVCGGPKSTAKYLPGTKLVCGKDVGPICMGYNIKCWKTTLANCKATCAKSAGCKVAEYSSGGTCCTSKYATKAGCPGSFTKSGSWKGYAVCGAPKGSSGGAKTLPGTSLKCGSDVGPICMGYNIRCWRTSLANCKANCKATKACKVAEYAAGSRTCCTSAHATKATCPGSFTSSSSWKGYAICK